MTTHLLLITPAVHRSGKRQGEYIPGKFDLRSGGLK
jgi:hypothetical protein